ncbi:glycosyltransferase family 2 protein [Myxosarcina sp. GI1]|uniref:glycosyltransferase family 2 protein n=1 Tax=Myxosarcina sp. GI1 TaxID=1541065 RepID=UPI00055D37E8|nr:glycosyltransferase family 2 protein [Myxosarcina sp. GI1]
MSNTIQSDVLVVIVNYRTPDLTINCLRSLVPEVRAVPGITVTVVDNNSEDGSVAKIQQAIAAEGWEDWANLLPSSHNGGFAYGNNLAMRPAMQSANPPTYFLLLNPDTEIRLGAIKILVDFMECHPQAGIAGSGFELADGTPWQTILRFPSLLSELDSGLRLGIVSKLLSKWVVARPSNNEICETDWLPGASMLIRRQVVESVGLMDEEYFLYYEETDYCLQVKRAGWTCWCVPQSLVMHIGGQSTGVDVPDSPPKRLPKYCFDSRRRYFTKNYGFWYAAIADLLWILGFSLWKIRQTIQRKPNYDPPYYLQDFIQNSVWLYWLQGLRSKLSGFNFRST